MERLKEASYEDRHRVEKTYKEKLRAMDGRIRAVRSKERRLAQVERLQERSLEKCAALQADIQAIKTQKVLRLACWGCQPLAPAPPCISSHAVPDTSQKRW